MMVPVTAMIELHEMLAALTVSVRPDRYTFVTMASPAKLKLDDSIEAVVREVEGTTVVTTVDRARARGWDIGFEAAWLTIEIHSALEAVGLTAALSAVLAEAGIPCNVLAGFHHDHLLVPPDRVDDSLAAIESLRAG